MHYITTPSGMKWNYELEGEGDVLFFIHGWGVNMRIWRQQSKYFSQYFKTIAIDLPGHGKSSWKKMTLQEIGEEINTILKELGVKRMNVVASSFGGLIALKVTEIFTEEIVSMCFIGSHARFARASDYPYGLDQNRIHHLADQLKEHYPNMVNIFFRSLFTKDERASRRFKWIQTFRKTDDIPEKEALLELLEVLEAADLRETLSKLKIPLQFVNGTEDHICPREIFFHLENKMPNARFEWFEQCGHFPFLSKPHEFNQVLEDFLFEVNGINKQ